MLDAFGQVVVIDWGVASFFDTDAHRAYLDAVGGEWRPEGVPPRVARGGTPAYMPPEQFDGGTLGPAADIYSAGAMLFEMLTGRLPHEGSESLFLLAFAKGTERPPTVTTLRPDVSERLSDLVGRMLRADPRERPASFQQVLDEFNALGDLGAELPTRVLAAGEILIREGEEGGTMFQVLRGALEVRVSDGGAARTVARRGPGEIVGELALLSSAPRTATVVAVEESEVRPLDQAALEAELAKLNPLIGKLLRSLSDKLVETMR